jgi:hypothetical protein
MGIKLFNYLPLNLKKLYKDVKRFKLQLGEFLSCHSFYILDEYIVYSSWKDWLHTGCFMYSNSLYYITLLYVFTCLYNYIDIVLCTAYFVFDFSTSWTVLDLWK